jgi:hypothetical protein
LENFGKTTDSSLLVKNGNFGKISGRKWKMPFPTAFLS